MEEARRSRRSSKYSGDYQTAHFSEIDDSDEDDRVKKPATKKTPGKARAKECPGCSAMLSFAVKECVYCDYTFTSKSMLNLQQTATEESKLIRDRFPFEPEREEDGSLKIQMIFGRRPRTEDGKRWLKSNMKSFSAMDSKFDYEYLIKYKSMSYLHVQWTTANEIESMNPQNRIALNRYLNRIDKGDPTVQEDGEFDPSYIEVDRILDMREEEVLETIDDPAPEVVEASAGGDSSTEPVTLSNVKAEDSGTVANMSSAGAITNASNEVQSTGDVALAKIRIWLPQERCRRVLEKIMNDNFSTSFIDPVDTDMYDDYLDIVDTPMCLNDVLENLDNNKYKGQYYTKFAYDMRLIWKNCKAYNLYKSQIWYCAHTLSLQFERLYQAWVLSYQDASLFMTDPLARPWESTCRICLLDEEDDSMMLCDHCDAPYHIYCLKPPLPAVPEGAWICPRCQNWFAKSGAKVLSAQVEEDARNLSIAARSRKIVKVMKKKYLVKWRGLSYRDCTWESEKDINDDVKIANYHKLNDTPPEEPPLTQAEIGAELSKDKRNQLYPAMTVPNLLKDLEGTIYAQIRSYHFLKSKQIPPVALLKESGPSTYGATYGATTEICLPKGMTKLLRIADNSLDPNNAEEMLLGYSSKSQTTNDNDSISDVKLDENTKDSDDMEVDNQDESSSDEDSVDDKKAFDAFKRTMIPVKGLTSEEFHDAAQAAYEAKKLAKKEEKKRAKMVIVRNGDGNVSQERYESRCQEWYAIPPIDLPYSTATLPNSLADPSRQICADVLSKMVYSIARNNHQPTLASTRSKLLSYEIEVCVAKGTGGLFMNIGDYKDRVVVLGFRRKPDGTMGPAEVTGKIKVGDILIGINGTYVSHIGFKHIIKILSTTSQPYVYLRFLRINPESQNTIDLITKERTNSVNSSSRRPTFKRSKYFGVYYRPVDGKWQAEIYKEDVGEMFVIGVYENQEDAAHAYDNEYTALHGSDQNDLAQHVNFTSTGELTDLSLLLSKYYDNDTKLTKERLSDLREEYDQEEVTDEREIHSCDSYDSDSTLNPEDSAKSESSDSDGSSSASTEDDESWGSDVQNDVKDWKPKDEIEASGPTGRLLRAVNQSDFAPLRSEWNNYIVDISSGQEYLPSDAGKHKKVDQIDLASGSVIRTWDTLAAASRGTNIPIYAIQQVLKGKTDNGGGFKWRVSPGQNKLLEPQVKKIGVEESPMKKPVSNDGIVDVAVDEEESAIRENDDGLEEIIIKPKFIRPEGEEENEEEDGTKFDFKREESNWQAKRYKKSKEYLNGGTLRDYQLYGLNWLLRCWYCKRSSILADEMGLGKTVQVVTFLDHLFEVEKIAGPFLISVPLSTIEHWRRETEGWSRMAVCLYHDMGGGRDMRDVIREFDWYYKNRSRRVLKFQVLITTYDDLIRDYEELAEVPWRVVVVDEAHRLRNSNSKLLECMRSVCAKGQVAYGYQHRILMTGTPLQNNTAELWSLLNFIEPAKFPDAEKFLSRFGNIQTQEQVETLQQRIAPHLLRRVKEDVAKDIPPKEETIIDVELTTMQKQYYRAIFEHNHGFLMQSTKGSLPKLMNIQMELRKCCNHPYLITGVEQKEMEDLEVKLVNKMNDDNYGKHSIDDISNTEFDGKRITDSLIPNSGKMVLIDKLLPKLLREGHKVLIFSQMVKMIDIIEEFCEFRKYNHERLDGRVQGNDRQKAIDRFNNQPDSFVFLLSTRAGGVGINLTAADTVIIFDSDWNPQNDVQAMARCHRIGQLKSVKVYRLITRRSFEAEMFERASKKLGLERALLNSRQFNDMDESELAKTDSKMDAKEVELLLRHGAYSALLDDDAEAVRQFCEQDIESLLDQRSHVRVLESQASESWLNKKKASERASKSLFTGESSMEHAEIDVNDPDFWKKVLPDLVTPDMMLDRLTDLIESEEEDEETIEEMISKFMADMQQLMDGMLDLRRRGQLPDRERVTCMKLLLRITLQTEMFDDQQLAMSMDWLNELEGSRRRNKPENYVDDNEDSRSGRRNSRGKPGPKKGSGRGSQRGSKSFSANKAKRPFSFSAFAGDIDFDDEDEDQTSQKRMRRSLGGSVTPRRKRGKKSDVDENGDPLPPKPRGRPKMSIEEKVLSKKRRNLSRSVQNSSSRNSDDEGDDDDQVPADEFDDEDDEPVLFEKKTPKSQKKSMSGKKESRKKAVVSDDDDVEDSNVPQRRNRTSTSSGSISKGKSQSSSKLVSLEGVLGGAAARHKRERASFSKTDDEINYFEEDDEEDPYTSKDL